VTQTARSSSKRKDIIDALRGGANETLTRKYGIDKCPTSRRGRLEMESKGMQGVWEKDSGNRKMLHDVEVPPSRLPGKRGKNSTKTRKAIIVHTYGGEALRGTV